MKSTDLESLFDRYRHEGDLTALAEVFDRTAPQLLQVALHMVGNLPSAEDVLQETFLAAIQNSGTYSSSRKLTPWLCGILANKAKKWKSGLNRSPDLKRLSVAQEGTAVDQVEKKELSSLLAKALKRLPEPYCQVLTLHLQQGMEPVSVARDLGRSPNTVRTQIKRGLDRLRQVLPQGLAPAFIPLGLDALREKVLAQAVSHTTTVLAVGSGTIASPTIVGILFMKKTLILAVSLLTLGAIAFYSQSGNPPQTPTAGSQPQPGQAPLIAKKAKAPILSPVANPPKRRTVPDEKQTGSDIPPPCPGFDLIPGEPTMDVLVLDPNTEKPISGAMVRWYFYDDRIHDPLSQALLTTDLKPRNLPEIGSPIFTDERGIAAIPATSWLKLIYANKGERWGSTQTSQFPGLKYKIYLSRVQRLKLQVIDSNTNGVSGVPVAIYSCSGGIWGVPWRGVTGGPDGTVTAAFKMGNIERYGQDARFFAGFDNPVLLGKRVPIPAKPAGGDPLRLTLPKTGGIEVLLHDLTGNGSAKDACATISIVKPLEGPGPHPKCISHTSLAIPIKGGRALIPRVALGQSWYIDIFPRDGLAFKKTQIIRFPGPTLPGEIKQVSLTLKECNPVIKGRVVDRQNRPIGDALLSTSQILMMNGNPITLAGQCVKTDKEGRFSAVIRSMGAGFFPGIPKVWEVVWWKGSDSNGKPLGPKATPSLPFPLTGGISDLGDIRLEESVAPPLVAAGIVLDDRGAPLGGIKLRVSPAKGTKNISSLFRSGKALSGTTDRKGRFEIFGTISGPVEISVSDFSWKLKKKVSLPLGTKGIELRLCAPSELMGSVLLEKELPISAISIVRRDGKGKEITVNPRAKRSEWVEKEIPGRPWNRRGGFYCKGLKPGKYTVMLKIGGRLLHTIKDVIVPSSGCTLDPRLVGIDLRGRFRSQPLRVQDLNKNRIRDFRVLDMDAPAGSREIYINSSRRVDICRLLIPKGTSLLAVGAPGFQPTRFAYSGTLQEILLSPGATITGRFKLPAQTALKELVYFEIKLLGLDPGQRKGNLLRTGLDPRRYANPGKEGCKIVLPGPGRFALQWILVLPDKRETTIATAKPVIFSVPPGQGKESHEFTLSREDRDRALKSLK